jgi:hypothetical protein
MQELTLDDFVDRLIFAENQTAEYRYWWISVTLSHAYQELPRYEADYLSSLYDE